MLDIKIEQKKEQPLLSRVMLKGFVGFEKSTPSRSDFRKKLSEMLKEDEKKVAVSSISTLFGEKKASFEAHVYNSPADVEKFESVVVLARHGLREKKAKAAKEKPAK